MSYHSTPSSRTKEHELLIRDCRLGGTPGVCEYVEWLFEHLDGPRAGEQFRDMTHLVGDDAKNYLFQTFERLNVHLPAGTPLAEMCSAVIGKRVGAEKHSVESVEIVGEYGEYSGTGSAPKAEPAEEPEP